MLNLAEVASLGPHDSLSHYRDSHLCTMASNPNEKKTQARTHVRLPHLLLYKGVSPNDTSCAFMGPHRGFVYEDKV